MLHTFLAPLRGFFIICALFIALYVMTREKTKLNNEWDALDSDLAAKAGWQLVEFWDMDTARLQFIVMKTDGSLFPTDEHARFAVEAMAKKGSKLALKANAIVFKSRIGFPDATTSKKGKKRGKGQ